MAERTAVHSCLTGEVEIRERTAAKQAAVDAERLSRNPAVNLRQAALEALLAEQAKRDDAPLAVKEYIASK